MVKGRRRPRAGGVAENTGSGEAGSDVTGVGGAGEVGRMAGVAIGWGTYKDVVDVARCARNSDVRAGEWERSVVVIEHRASP